MMHPRPHLVRPRWQSLDGGWDFAFDPRDVGEREGWYLPGRIWPSRIEVPFPWESPRSGVGPPAPDHYVRGATGWLEDTGWYARQVDIPAEWTGDRIWLVIGAAYWETRVWVDGRHVGEHLGGYDPFDLDISDRIVRAGHAEVVLRVRAPKDSDEYPHGKNSRHWYSRASGIWQGVFIEPRPATHVARLRVHPDPVTGEVEVGCEVHSAAAGSLITRLDVSLKGSLVASSESHVQGQEGISIQTLRATVSSPGLWDCESPTLYDIRVHVVADDGRADVVETTAGFRNISFEALHEGGPRWLHLNGQPLYLRAVMSQGYHPQGILAYPDEAVIKHDLETAKLMGFNMVRLHVKVEDPRLLAWADRLGILLWCEVPNFLTPTPAARERWEMTWRRMLERDSGHPSIALWCMFIESWGLGLNQFGFGGAERHFVDDPEMQGWVAEMYALGRSLDPTRPIIENSVCEADHTVAEVNDIHLFPSGYGELATRVRPDLDAWVAGAYPGSGHNFADGYRQEDQPLLVSSMAGWASVDGVETSFPFRTLVNEVRIRERIAGYGWVQLYDVEWELTGMLTYDRRAKALGFDATDVNADDVVVVDGPLAKCAVAQEPIELDLRLAHASGRISGPVGLRVWLDGHDAIWQQKRTHVGVATAAVIVERRGVIALGRITIPSPGEPFAGYLIVEAHDASARRVARTQVNVAWLASGSTAQVTSLLAMPLERWASTSAPVIDTLSVGSGPERIAAPGLTYRFRVPESAVRGLHREIHLLAEAAIVDAEPRGRSLEEVEPVPIHILLDGVVTAEAILPMLRADSRGTLSIIHPEGLGSYGDRLHVSLGRIDRLAGGEHSVEIQPAVPESGQRIVLFGPLLGRAPLGPALVYHDSSWSEGARRE